VSNYLIAFCVIVSGGTFIVFAQIARARAVGKRGGSIRVAARGPAQIAPYFFWVPYVLVVLRPAPELDVPDALRVIGCAAAVAGVGLALWAIGVLGRHYDLVLEIHADHELVRSGPYAFVRHPVYTGLAVHFLGACLATGNALLIVGTLLGALPLFVVRARLEEGLLRARFGGAYDRYASEVPMLVPGVRWPGGKT